MDAGWLVPCLVIVSIFVYTRSFGHVQPFSQLLAKETLQAASHTVREAVQPLFAAYEDVGFERKALGTKLERLQLSLDNQSLLEELSPVNGKYEIDLCASLAGKRLTMIGGEHIYRLHRLLLQDRELAEGKPFPCRYHEFCTHHHICLPFQHDSDDTLRPRYVKPPTAQELTDTESAVVNYLVSDTLHAARNESSWEYTSPFVDPSTGVRLRETYWLAAARKATVVILGRGPLSAPGQTYGGNWSFLCHVPNYIGQSRDSVASRYADNYSDCAVPHALDILNAAIYLTVTRFLPDLFQLLRSIRNEVHPSTRKRLIWASSWYRLPGRGVARTVILRHSNIPDMIQHNRPRSSHPYVLLLQLSALLNTGTILDEDPWTLLFNAQVYLQNMVLRELLPRHGVVFLPLDIPWAEDVQTRGHDTATDDFERVGQSFLTGVDYVLRYLE